MSEKSVYTFIILLFLKQDFAISIRITELTVPSHAVEGGSVLLQCHYDLEGEMLYSIKWYKDGREFFRYVPSNSIPFSYFPLAGVDVYENDSSNNVVKLVNLTPESSGLYRCEVSGEGPYFVTVFDEKNISVHLLPYRRPQVMGLQGEYKIGDFVAVNCTSSRSRPQTHLKWLINNESVPRRHLTGPWYRISRERPDARETILQLRFIVQNEHFKNGIMQLKISTDENEVHLMVGDTSATEDQSMMRCRPNFYFELSKIHRLKPKHAICTSRLFHLCHKRACQSSIAPLYQDEVVHQIVRAEDNVIDPISEEVLNEEINRLFDQQTQESPHDITDAESPVAELQNDHDHGAIFTMSLPIIVIVILLQIVL